MMKQIRFDSRIIIGLLLIAGGGLVLAQTMGYLENASKYFWGLVFVLGGLAFAPMLLNGEWWAVFPCFNLLSLGGVILLPESLEKLSGG
ncbi:MAG: hypothetical protein ACK40V_09145, partial [Anaerolineales bacterium]